MTLDLATIERCAKAIKAERERLIAQPLASVWRQLAEAAIRALASEADGTPETKWLPPPHLRENSDNSLPSPKNDCGTQRCRDLGCFGYCTPTGSGPVVMQDYAPAGTSLAALRAANIARQREWDTGNQITLTYRGNEFAGEVGEVCNVIKKLERERLGIAGSRDTVEHLGEELADAVICADLIAMTESIDLGVAIVAKFNATSEKVGLKTRLTTSSPAEVSEEELARWLHANAFAMVDAVMSPAKKESMIPFARALLAQFIIGRRV